MRRLPSNDQEVISANNQQNNQLERESVSIQSQLNLYPQFNQPNEESIRTQNNHRFIHNSIKLKHNSWKMKIIILKKLLYKLQYENILPIYNGFIVDICENCKDQVNECPQCRKRIKSRLRVYIN
mgnify:CR=1 FL=1